MKTMNGKRVLATTAAVFALSACSFVVGDYRIAPNGGDSDSDSDSDSDACDPGDLADCSQEESFCVASCLGDVGCIADCVDDFCDCADEAGCSDDASVIDVC